MGNGGDSAVEVSKECLNGGVTVSGGKSRVLISGVSQHRESQSVLNNGVSAS
jgi:hypothetical protein